MGTSMGGMHTWVWGERHPEFMDALMPLASLPVQISGRNRVWRKTLIDAIRNDPAWRGGNYTAQPPVVEHRRLTHLSSWAAIPCCARNSYPRSRRRMKCWPQTTATAMRQQDANDVLYQVSASWDYDPAPGLERIRAPLFAVNSADDLINPPELGILEREIKRVKHGEAVVMPAERADARPRHAHASLRCGSSYLVKLLAESEQHAAIKPVSGRSAPSGS